LTSLKRKLVAAKEKLQDQKYLERSSAALSKNEWSHGK